VAPKVLRRIGVMRFDETDEKALPRQIKSCTDRDAAEAGHTQGVRL
jgi:hypothetical protein